MSVPPLSPRRTRSERVALYSSSKGPVSRLVEEMRRDHQGFLLFFLFAAVGLMGFVLQTWDPPFPFRLNAIPSRSIVCNTPFAVENPEGKEQEEKRARWETPHIFVNDSQPLVQVRESLWNTVAALVHAPSYDELDGKGKDAWYEFLKQPASEPETPVDPKQAFEQFCVYFKEDPKLDRFNATLKRVFTSAEAYGVLSNLSFGPTEGNQEKIMVYRLGDLPEKAVAVKVSDVLIRDGARLFDSLRAEMQSEPIARRIFQWIRPRLKDTLKQDDKATATAILKAVEAVGIVMQEYAPGQVIVEMGVPLGMREINLLRAEYHEAVKNRSQEQKLFRFSAIFVTMATLLVVCWRFVYRRERRRPKSLQAASAFLFGIVLTVVLAKGLDSFSQEIANWELLPLLVFAQLVSILYSWELAIVFSTVLVFFISIGLGFNNNVQIILLGTTVITALQLGRLRSRRKLITVSLSAGIVAFVLTFSVGIMGGRIQTWPLLIDSSFNLLWALLAGFILNGLLPFIEEPFGILTDMSLYELGDVSHPLLQSLVRLAPATYGHSMAVGTIAETAAEAIGARGLMTRVGAYYHDIGKIMKPEHYSENQQTGGSNIHDSLEPQVSTIVLIAHVKDGIDLVRQHRLPRPIVELVEQHHGTSLVSFFYGRAASKVNKDDPQSSQAVEESTYRYPGPKPQSKEAAILMIADSCESACRSIRDNATPGKLENKIRQIIKQKLDDGQFDDSGLTLRELKIIENSVIKSVLAAMHGRIKYPGPDEAETSRVDHGIKGDSVAKMEAVTKAEALAVKNRESVA